MIITLYLNDKLHKFRLPVQVSGSYQFDYEETETKLINVEAKDGKWYLYQTDDVKIETNNMMMETIELVPNNFYKLLRNDKSYLIFVNEIKLNDLLYFDYNNLNLTIGNNNANITYNCPYLNNSYIKITQKDSSFILERTGNIPIYVNSIIVNEQAKKVDVGDQIEILGLKIIFYNSMFIMNNIPNKVMINISNSNIKAHIFDQIDKPEDIEVKDIDLYAPSDYYLKSPRIRRLIEKKTFKLSAPPSGDSNEELPLILTIGPMLTMGIMSFTTIISVMQNLSSGKTTMGESWPQLVTSVAMIASMLLWPLITRKYNSKIKEKKKKETFEKYTKYLKEKRVELEEERKIQSVILNENLINIDDCLNIIKHKNINFWDKRNDQNDFLTVRIGIGNEKFEAEIDYTEEDFSIDESDLRKEADKLKEEYEYIYNVPIGFSFYENKSTAIMGKRIKTVNFLNNILLQLLTFYSYDDLKIVVFTDKKNEKDWDYLKYLNHTFSNDRTIRFYSTDYDTSKNIADYLDYEINSRVEGVQPYPQYFIIVDGFDNVKKHDFIKTMTEIDDNIGMNVVFIEDKLSKLPSKCNNFIMLGDTTSELLINSYEEQKRIVFKDEIHYDLNMFNITKELSNVPIEFAEGVSELPNTITFLEMEKVGKVEQLNILNRWNQNDSTASLRAEVGVDERGDLMYLDLHEKAHGPHGLIAGTTGSGKSEFIITYILSMVINYSPDDVAFILIDYKGGGLAFAFENKTTGVVLPHLAGTITNLDKAEMDRTLVSIDSEVKRRQQKFNEARELLGESTIDIYKYQRFYKEGKLQEPIPHLFIVCDEFAELKSQQPDFMDNLISVARIGRSLGVHLILATQKPSGVVNDQIWSNSKFKVCLKVQDEQDSKEMLKKPDAAYIKETGRFYLQVGYDEYFALGQSAWCGAKYYPSEKIIKQVDKSINIIDDSGYFVKSIQASGGPKIKPQGEQLSSILNNVIEVSEMVDKKARRLWLDNVEPVILVDNLIQKYNVQFEQYNPQAIIGEYDAPEMQEQGIILYNFLEDGNTIIYGMDGMERENMLNSILYSSLQNHTSEEINYYIIDYGSETLRIFNGAPQIGGMVFASDEEKFNNLIKLLKEEIKNRKALFANYGGDYKSYIKNSGKLLPLKVVIINNYDSLYENKQNLYDILPELVRDSERYGIVFILTANAANSVQNKLLQNFNNSYALRVKDSSEYSSIFDQMTKMEPREIEGRGLFKQDVIHEFQTASIVDSDTNLNDFLTDFVNVQKSKNSTVAKGIPILPEFVRLDNVNEELKGLNSIPIGITKEELEIVKVDFLQNIGNIISSNKLQNTEKFVKSLLYEFNVSNINTIIFDPLNQLNYTGNNYYIDHFTELLDDLSDFLQNQIDNKTSNEMVLLIYGVDKFLSKLEDKMKFENLVQLIKQYEKLSLIVVDAGNKLKQYSFEGWFTSVLTVNDGIWIGRGISDQGIIRLSTISKDMTKEIKNDVGYYVSEGSSTLCKFIDFVTEGDSNEE